MSYKQNYIHMLQNKIEQADIQQHQDIILAQLGPIRDELERYGFVDEEFLPAVCIIADSYLAITALDDYFINRTDPETQYIRTGFYSLCEFWFGARAEQAYCTEMDFQSPEGLKTTGTLLQFLKDTADGANRLDSNEYGWRLNISCLLSPAEEAAINND